MSQQPLKAPFPWFGSKTPVTPEVWERLGNVNSYIEPFAGSLAVLLNRPDWHGQDASRIEIANDIDGYVCNFWRATSADPEAVAKHASAPINENDLHARHIWLVNNAKDFARRLEADPDLYDARAAGWWVWGCSAWIGSGWCRGSGAWDVKDGLMTKVPDGAGGGVVTRQLPHIALAGRGITLQTMVSLGEGGHEQNRLDGVLRALQVMRDRMRDVKVACGDWKRVVTDSLLKSGNGCTGVFLDPPYGDDAKRTPGLYTTDSLDVANDVREWAIEHGNDPSLRIALCGYEGEHKLPDSWTCYEWKASGGFGNMRKDGTYENNEKERIWFSPHCVSKQRTMFM